MSDYPVAPKIIKIWYLEYTSKITPTSTQFTLKHLGKIRELMIGEGKRRTDGSLQFALLGGQFRVGQLGDVVAEVFSTSSSLLRLIRRPM